MSAAAPIDNGHLEVVVEVEVSPSNAESKEAKGERKSSEVGLKELLRIFVHFDTCAAAELGDGCTATKTVYQRGHHSFRFAHASHFGG
mgnify:CR=1 FL=1